MNKHLWVLDAGHGINTKGKRSPKWNDGSQLFEWEFNRDIVKRIANKCKQLSIKYHILVPEDIDISLKKRCERANNLKSNLPKITVSVHGNAAGVEQANGYEVWTSPGKTESDKVATVFYNEAKHITNLKMRKDFSDGDPDKESRFYILIHTKMPCILTENGFFTNEKESHLMLTNKYRNMIAEAHVQAMHFYDQIKTL